MCKGLKTDQIYCMFYGQEESHGEQRAVVGAEVGAQLQEGRAAHEVVCMPRCILFSF